MLRGRPEKFPFPLSILTYRLMRQAHFKILRGEDLLFHFRLLDADNELLLTGNSYFFRPGCYVGIATARTCCQPAGIMRHNVAYRYSFSLHDAAGALVGHGASFFTEAARDQAIRRVLQAAPSAPVVQHTQP